MLVASIGLGFFGSQEETAFFFLGRRLCFLAAPVQFPFRLCSNFYLGSERSLFPSGLGDVRFICHLALGNRSGITSENITTQVRRETTRNLLTPLTLPIICPCVCAGTFTDVSVSAGVGFQQKFLVHGNIFEIAE